MIVKDTAWDCFENINQLYTYILKRFDLQSIRSAVAQVITTKVDHINPVEKSLHWLPVSQRIDYKNNSQTIY